MHQVARRAFLALFVLFGTTASLALAAGPSPGVASETRFDPDVYDGGDGLSREAAVVLRSRSPEKTVAAEYAWMRHHYPGAKPLRQAVTPWNGGKRFDAITIRTRDGREMSLWFDISAMQH